MDDSHSRFHPHYIMLVLLLAGLSMIFLSLSGAYIYTRVQHHIPAIQLPGLFFFNTLILLFSSYTLILAKRAYQMDETDKYQRFLLITLGLSVAFLALQWRAWQQLYTEQLYIHSDLSTSYVYALFILHFLHVIGGIPFLFKFVWSAYNRLKEPVSVLVYFSDPDKKRALQLLSIYWHFLDFLWIYLIIFLGLNMLI